MIISSGSLSVTVSGVRFQHAIDQQLVIRRDRAATTHHAGPLRANDDETSPPRKFTLEGVR